MDTDKNLKREKANHDLARLRTYWRTASDHDAVRIVAAVRSINRRSGGRHASAADLSGRKFGRLTAVIDARGSRCIYWLCICLCGRRAAVRAYSLTTARATSCGCRQKEVAKVNIALANAGRGAK